MKKRIGIRIFKRKTYIYVLGNVKIKSDIKLDKAQVTDICSIIKEHMKRPMYGTHYQIATEIFYKIETELSKVKFYEKKKKFLVIIGKEK